MGNRIKEYWMYILESELKHMAVGSVPKLSMWSILLLYIKLNDTDKNIPKYANYIPSDLNQIENEYIEDARHLTSYINSIFSIICSIDGRVKINNNTLKIKKILENKNNYYVFYAADGTPKLLMASTMSFKPIKKDVLTDPSSFYIQPDLRKVTYEDAEDFMYNARLKDQDIIDNYWTRQVAKDPSKVTQAEKEVSELWKKEHEHLGTEFGFFDD